MTPEEVIQQFYQSHLTFGNLPLEKVRDPRSIQTEDSLVIRAIIGSIFEQVIPAALCSRDDAVRVHRGWYSRGEYREAQPGGTGSIRYFVQGHFPGQIQRSPVVITERQCRQGLVYRITQQGPQSPPVETTLK